MQIPPDMKVTDFINKVLNNNHHTSFPVVLDRRLHGMLSARRVETSADVKTGLTLKLAK